MTDCPIGKSVSRPTISIRASFDSPGRGALPARSGARLCADASGGRCVELGATSLTTVMQMVANGYGVTLIPEIAVQVEARDERVKLARFATPEPFRKVGLGWRRTSSRAQDFKALGQIVAGVVK